MSALGPSSPPLPAYSPLDSEDNRTFYQGRIALLNRMTFLLSLGFLVLHNTLSIATSSYTVRDALNASNGGHLASILVALSTWQLTRRRLLPAKGLVGLDLASMALQVLCYAAMAIVAPPSLYGRIDLVVVLIVTSLQMIRAVVVPSTPLRTIAVGVAVSLPVLAVAYRVGLDFADAGNRLPSPSSSTTRSGWRSRPSWPPWRRALSTV